MAQPVGTVVTIQYTGTGQSRVIVDPDRLATRLASHGRLTSAEVAKGLKAAELSGHTAFLSSACMATVKLAEVECGEPIYVLVEGGMGTNVWKRAVRTS